MTDYQGTPIADEDYAKIVAALVGESAVVPKIESPPLDFLRVLEGKVADHLGYPVKLNVEVMPVDASQDTTDGKVWVDIKLTYSPLYLNTEKLSALSLVDPAVLSQWCLLCLSEATCK